MIKCDSSWMDPILEYIGEDYDRCAYIYVDLKKYAFQNDEVDVWVSLSGSKITAVVLRYYKCLHLFSKENDFEAEDIVTLFSQNSHDAITLEKDAYEKIKSYSYIAEVYDVQRRTILTEACTVNKYMDMKIEVAEYSDLMDIANMIYKDEDFFYPDFEMLFNEIKERFEDGFSRYWLIRENKKIVAFTYTMAEIDNLAVIGPLLVDKQYRGNGYGGAVVAYMYNTLIEEGKKYFSFLTNQNSKEFHLNLGYKLDGENIKLMKR